jgi:hypothetical protein
MTARLQFISITCATPPWSLTAATKPSTLTTKTITLNDMLSKVTSNSPRWVGDQH